tara:strand:- start:3194 stop:3442 length:249 start_codon:yes stop_codon:yes gene_type:complete
MFTVGPFMSSSYNIAEFARNIQHIALLKEAIEISLDHDEKVQKAIDENNDPEYIEILKRQNEYYDEIFEFSISGAFDSEEYQ